MAFHAGIIYLAPGQRPEVIKGIKDLGHRVEILSSLEIDCEFGTPSGKAVKIELKEVPGDLVSSLRSSQRMSRQAIALGGNEGPSIFMMVGYPDFRWRFSRETGKRYLMMMDGIHETGLTYGEFQNRMLTFAMIGVLPVHVPTWNEVGETIGEFYDQFQRDEHQSHLQRPTWAGHNLVKGWDKPTAGDAILHIYQGFESVGLGKGKVLWKFFGDLRHLAVAQAKYIAMTPGIGKKTAENIERQVLANYDDYFDEEDKPIRSKWK